MSPLSPKHPLSADEVRCALRALGQVQEQEPRPGEAHADAREFGAELHRRLVAAGAPPVLTWLGACLGRLRDAFWANRPVLTGAVLGALVTATVFLLLGTNRGGRDAHTTVGTEPASAIEQGLVVRPALAKSVHTLGDRHVARDRLGEDIGAERPERAQHVHGEKR